MKENVIQTKSYEFALRIVKLHLYLKNEKKEFELSKQILRSGTSVVQISKKLLEACQERISLPE